jgi:hypothetical protein
VNVTDAVEVVVVVVVVVCAPAIAGAKDMATRPRPATAAATRATLLVALVITTFVIKFWWKYRTDALTYKYASDAELPFLMFLS